jgi:hypothetical protein
MTGVQDGGSCSPHGGQEAKREKKEPGSRYCREGQP